MRAGLGSFWAALNIFVLQDCFDASKAGLGSIQPALWFRGIADGLRASRRQLAAVRLPPGPGRESDVVHRLRLKRSDQGTCPKWRSHKKKAGLGSFQVANVL